MISVCLALVASSCGGSSSTPQSTLHDFLTAWTHRDWPAMRKLVSAPPADFASVNSAALSALGVVDPRFRAGPIKQSGSTTSARVTEELAIPGVGLWTPQTTAKLAKHGDDWLVSWSPATINPSLRRGDRLLLDRVWPTRAPILGAGGAHLTTQRPVVTVGVVGRRIKHRRAVASDLLAAGAPRAAVSQALAQAKAHPSFFEPVFRVSRSRFEQLKRQSGPGNVYAVPGTQFQSTTARSAIGQLGAHLVGSVAPITAEQLRRLGSPYDAASTVGQNGLEQVYERRLAGTPEARIEVIDPGGATVSTLRRFPGHPGRPVATSIDPATQRAAEDALSGVHHDAALVAMRASTGQVLAVVSDPPSVPFDQGFEGRYPPGSTFKVLTASALIKDGLSPGSSASCPPEIDIGGEVFHNAEGDRPVPTLGQGFVESCNTTFIILATKRLKAGEFPAAARLYGLDQTAQPGLPAFLASVPAPRSRTELAATAIGQARVEFSPLGMAAVAAAIDNGTARAPRLVTGAPDDSRPGQAVPSAMAGDLRQMMSAVVTSGTAAGTGLPSGTAAKTGTAQYGSGPKLPTDAWLMGYRGDLAFAVVVQNSRGVNGGPLDGPIIARFLNALGPSG